MVSGLHVLKSKISQSKRRHSLPSDFCSQCVNAASLYYCSSSSPLSPLPQYPPMPPSHQTSVQNEQKQKLEHDQKRGSGLPNRMVAYRRSFSEFDHNQKRYRTICDRFHVWRVAKFVVLSELLLSTAFILDFIIAQRDHYFPRGFALTGVCLSALSLFAVLLYAFGMYRRWEKIMIPRFVAQALNCALFAAFAVYCIIAIVLVHYGNAKLSRDLASKRSVLVTKLIDDDNNNNNEGVNHHSTSSSILNVVVASNGLPSWTSHDQRRFIVDSSSYDHGYIHNEPTSSSSSSLSPLSTTTPMLADGGYVWLATAYFVALLLQSYFFWILMLAYRYIHDYNVYLVYV